MKTKNSIIILLFTPLVILGSQISFASNKEVEKPDVEKIEFLTTELKKLNPVNFDGEKARTLIYVNHVNFTKRPESIGELYTKITLVSAGSTTFVFKATLKEGRPSQGLKKGDQIALRMRSGLLRDLYRFGSGMFYPQGYEALIRLSSLRRQNITEYFPDFYGVYFGWEIPETIVTGKYPSNMKEHGHICSFRYEEMEWVDTTFEHYIDIEKKKISDSMIMEFLYGEWAGCTFAGICVDDQKYRNYGLKQVDYGRCYHLGELAYYFPAGLMPVRLDLEGFQGYNRKKRFSADYLFIKYIESESGKKFITAFDEKEGDLFTLFERYFSKHQKDPVWVNEGDPKAKHFFLEQKFIDIEKKLPKEVIDIL